MTQTLRSMIDQARSRIQSVRPNLLGQMGGTLGTLGQGNIAQAAQRAVGNLQAKVRGVADQRPRMLQSVNLGGSGLLTTRLENHAPGGGFRAEASQGPTPVATGGYRLAT